MCVSLISVLGSVCMIEWDMSVGVVACRSGQQRAKAICGESWLKFWVKHGYGLRAM